MNKVEEVLRILVVPDSSELRTSQFRRVLSNSPRQLEAMKVFLEKPGRACEVLDYTVTIAEAVSSVHPAAKSRPFRRQLSSWRMIIKYSSGSVLADLLYDRIEVVQSFKEQFRKLKETLGWSLTTEIWKTTLLIETDTEELLRVLNPIEEAY
ncbi:hypothetical protein ACEPAF_22 [Sanghuangporus sanghuang]